MKILLFPTAILGLAMLIPAPPARAGIDLDFRAELQWRATYDNDLDAAVILYEYSHYRGRQLVLYPDEQLEDLYDYQWGFRVRSVRVVGPVHIVLFDESGLWGHQLEVYHDIPDLGDYRMRLNTYSTFRWHRRARSAYVSFNPVGVEFRVELGHRILPRIYCARPIVPRYHRPAPSYRYYNPRPRYDYRPSRNNTHTRPYVTPPPPRVHRPDARPPTARPSYTPGRPPSALPGQRPGSGQTRPPSSERPSVNPPSGTPPTQARPDRPPSPKPSVTAPPSRPPSAPPSRPPSVAPSRTSAPPTVAPPSQNRPTTTRPPRATPSSRPPAAAPSRERPRNAPPPPPRRD